MWLLTAETTKRKRKKLEDIYNVTVPEMKRENANYCQLTHDGNQIKHG